MGKTKLLLNVLLFMLFVSVSNAQVDTVLIMGGSIGNFTGDFNFDIQRASTKSHVFTLYGDGTYGLRNGKNIRHSYEEKSDYTVTSYFIEPYEDVPPPKSITTGGVQNSGGLNTAMNMKGDVDIHVSWSPASEFENFFIVAFRNTTSATPIDGCLEFHYNNTEVGIADGRILEYDFVDRRRTEQSFKTNFNEKKKWDFVDLKYNEVRYVYVPTTVLKRPMSKLNLYANYLVDCKPSSGNDGGGSGSSGPEVNSTFLVRYWPHDPNFKAVDQECLQESEIEPQQLTYTVGFFNDGEYFANDVFTTDVLSRYLDPNSVHVYEMEYPNTLNFTLRGNVMEVDFMDIDLPGTNQETPMNYNYEDAFSYFKFSVCTNIALLKDICIENEVEIQFDKQSIFKTNIAGVCTREHCQYDPCGTPLYRASTPIPEKPSLQFLPNPFTDLITIRMDRKTDKFSPLQCDLIDLSGKTIQQLYNGNVNDQFFEKQFYLDDLSSGIYWIRVQTGQETYIEKVIKI